jgi:hypothetical protein
MDPPTYFKNVQLDEVIAFDVLVKKGKLYQAPLRKPLTVQTPLVKIHSITNTHASVDASPGCPLHAFFVEAERVAKDVCCNSSSVLGLSADQVESSFKSFVGERQVRVRLDPSFHAYNHTGEVMETVPQELDQARAVLRLEQISIGKTEIGILWKIVQAQTAEPVPTCMIDLDIEVPDDQDDTEPTEDEDGADFV